MPPSFKRNIILALATAALPLAKAGGCFDDATSPFDPNEWTYCQKIPSDSHEMYMYYTPLEDTVLIGFHAHEDTDGWTALGINGNGGMKGATFIVVRQDDDGTWIAEDRFANDYTMPAIDDQQDVKLLFAEQDNGQTAWGVAIPMSSCDRDGNDYDILDKNQPMLWALGNDHSFGYHAKRGQYTANLVQAPKEKVDSGSLNYDLRMPNVSIVMAEGGEDPTNPYICTYFDLQAIATEEGFSAEDPLHATGFSPILDPATEKYVHHMILYACDASLGPSDEWEHLKVVDDCVSMPEGCLEMKWPWAVGVDATVFPDNVGLPIGEDGSRFLMLQMHYYNPTLDENLIDSSGVKVHYTQDLREQDIGVMQIVGATNMWQKPEGLPTGKERVSMTFITSSECTQNNWNEPLNILGVAHHLHIYGIKQELSVVRDGVNLGSMRPEYHYDFKHQSMDDSVPAIRQLLPGDQINQFCEYDTRNAPGDIVEFGDFTQQEMCYSALYYYPRQPDRDVFGTMPMWFDTSICIEPATSDEFKAANVSACTELVYTNVPKMFRFEDEVDQPFDLPTVCNGGAIFDELLLELPYLCPEECRSTSTCTEDELAAHANGVCTFICNEVNLSLYPDLSRAETDAAYGNFGCDPFFYNPVPSIPDAPACQIKGNIDSIEVSEIVLKDISNVEETEPAEETEPETDSVTEQEPIEEVESTEETTEPEYSSSTKISIGAYIIPVSSALLVMIL